MVNDKLHIICGNCGHDKSYNNFSWSYSPLEQDEETGEILNCANVYITCDNCCTVHPLEKYATSEVEMQIKTQKRFSQEDCNRHLNCLYIFGDNLISQGKTGQAIIRDCSNTFGIPTKRYPSMEENSFFCDSKEELDYVESCFQRLINLIKEKRLHNYDTIILPTDGLGTGLAELPQRSPKIFNRINEFFNEELPDLLKSL